MTGDVGDEVARADLWDAAADERQRLADEREHLANEREQLASERERLADDHERQLDQHYSQLAHDDALDEVLDEEIARVEAEGRVARAEARLRRAVRERDSARLALEREDLSRTRHTADTERAAQRTLDATDDDGWVLERRHFVAVERDRLWNRRDESQDERDEVADRRERDADDRDRQLRQRDQQLDVLGTRHLAGGQIARDTPSTSDLAQVREQAVRQRRIAARARQRAAADRARGRQLASAVSFAPTADNPRLAAEFLALTRDLFASPRLDQTVERVLRFALECLPGYVAAAATISDIGLPELHIATDLVAAQFDALQNETGQGPSLVAYESPTPVHAVTLDRWPDLAPSAAELGIVDVLAYGLSVPRDGTWHPLGALTFYADTPVDLDDGTSHLGSILAAYTAVAAGLEQDRHDLSRREAALHRALSSRDVIGQAKGILMERQHVPAGQAFDILRRASQRLNLRLHEVATRLAETGEIPI